MSSKKKNTGFGIVYSTDPGFRVEEETESVETPAAAAQKLRIQLETKHRGGKTVTVVLGFQGKPEDLETLGKKIKNHCGTGGSAKDGEIIIQGDHREKVKNFLLKEGYKQTK